MKKIVVVLAIVFVLFSCDNPANDNISQNSDGHGNSGGSTTPGQTKPNRPTRVDTLVWSSSSIEVMWSSVSGATSYKLFYREQVSGDTFQPSVFEDTVRTVTTTSLRLNGLKANTTYQFWVKAVNSAGESDYSLRKSATTFQ